MQASVVIPLWNGADVIEQCLQSIFRHADTELLEVICVDNASEDDSAARVAQGFPQVRLLRQPVNLGFAGGVNVGISAGSGDVFVLLNQDCIVEQGWLSSFSGAFQREPRFGILGSTVLNVDGTINHAGAEILRPHGFSRHYTDGTGNSGPVPVDYVTGAVFALRREVWDQVGQFDEGFYPAYYEEADYCYRARRHGFRIGYAPKSRVTHLFSRRSDTYRPFRHAANQHKMRYRFVCKHFTDEELHDFLDAEQRAVSQEPYLNEVLGCLVGARETLSALNDILARRAADLGQVNTVARQTLLRRGLAALASRALAQATEDLTRAHFEDWDRLQNRARSLKQREHEFLARIYFRAPDEPGPESTLHRLWRLLVLRPLSFLIGRDYLLLSELNTHHVARFDIYEALLQVQQDLVQQMFGLFDVIVDHGGS